MRRFTGALLGMAVLSLSAQLSARAAIMVIDDTRLDENILFSANDFEFGFAVDGGLIQQGLNNPGSILLPEADATGQALLHTFHGSWITLGVPLPGPLQVAFLEPGTTTISDILFVRYGNGAALDIGTIDGTFISDASETGLDPALLIPGIQVISWDESLGAFDFSAPFLTALASSDVEAANGVPEATSFLIWGLGLAAMGLLSRRSHA